MELHLSNVVRSVLHGRRVSEYCETHQSGVKQEMRRASEEMNATVGDHGDHVQSRDEVPVKLLVLLQETLNIVSVGALKEEKCNTNLVLKEFSKKRRDRFSIVGKPCKVRHSKKEMGKNSGNYHRMKIRIGAHGYASNWAVASRQNDVLLDIPRHVSNNPRKDYRGRVVKVGDRELLLRSSDEEQDTYGDTSCSYEQMLAVTNLAVKNFRRMLRKKGNREDF